MVARQLRPAQLQPVEGALASQRRTIFAAGRQLARQKVVLEIGKSPVVFAAGRSRIRSEGRWRPRDIELDPVPDEALSPLLTDAGVGSTIASAYRVKITQRERPRSGWVTAEVIAAAILLPP